MLISNIGVTSKHNYFIVKRHLAILDKDVQCAVQTARLNILRMAITTLRRHTHFQSWIR
jgi:hypothetical protein